MFMSPGIIARLYSISASTHDHQVTDLLNAIPRNLILPPGSLFLLIAVGLLVRRWWPRAGGAVAA